MRQPNKALQPMLVPRTAELRVPPDRRQKEIGIFGIEGY